MGIWHHPPFSCPDRPLPSEQRTNPYLPNLYNQPYNIHTHVIPMYPSDLTRLACLSFPFPEVYHSFAFSGCAAKSGIIKSLISHAASLMKWLMRSAPIRLQTMLKLRLKGVDNQSEILPKLKRKKGDKNQPRGRAEGGKTCLFSLIMYAIPNPSSIT